jgi:malonyl CoA-acyl carrier protein transacylase
MCRVKPQVKPRVQPRPASRRARVPHILFATVALTSLSFAQLGQPQSAESGEHQTTPADKEQDSPARRQAALAMLDLALAGARNLTLPQNRIAVESEAFPMLWNRNESQARALISQMVGDFAQAASRQDGGPDRNARPALRQQWQVVLQTVSQADAELALSFMNASRSFVQTGNPEQEEAEERALRLNLAAQEAAHNPRNALRIAEKDLQAPGDPPAELINLLSQVTAKDAEAGAQLLHDIVRRVRGAELSSGDGNFNFALNLLTSQFGAATTASAPDDALKTLADAVASAALNPQFPPTSLPNLQGSMPALEQLAPGRAQSLHDKLAEYLSTLTPEQKTWDQFSAAQASGDPNQLLAVAEQAPANVRPNLYQQVAWQFANGGDLERARQVADHLVDPFQRDQVMQQALRQSAWNACNTGDFAAARRLAEQITPEEDRAMMLAQFALNAVGAKQQALAQSMLDDAGALLANQPPSASAFAAQLQVAQAFVHLKPARALPLLERSASQLDQVLAAAVEVDAFLPYQRSFEAGELILNNGFLFNSLIQPYVQATAELASYDLSAARVLADRLPLPEARLMAELSVARTALGDPAVVAGVSMRRGFTVFLRR